MEARQPVKLWVNASGLGPDSQLRIELLDEQERPLPGYAERQSAVLTTAGLRVPVSWAAHNAISAMGRPFKIRARLEGPERNGIQVFAFYLGR